MDTKWKSYSHSILTKIIVFLIVITCFTGAISVFLNTVNSNNLDIVFEDSFYHSAGFGADIHDITEILTMLIGTYKDEESKANETQSKEVAIDDGNLKLEEEEGLKEYNSILQRLEKYKGLKYYISDGKNILTNSSDTKKNFFKAYPSYIVVDKSETNIYPKEIAENQYHYHWFMSNISNLEQQNTTMYVAFTEEFLNPRIEEWNSDKELVTNELYKLAGFLIGLFISFIYLITIVGRESFKDKEVHLNSFDRLYNDFNIAICAALILLWFGSMNIIFRREFYRLIIPATSSIAVLGLIFVLSLIKHIKNKTLIKHTLVYTAFYKFFKFIKDIFDSGSVGKKIIFIVTGYPIVVVLAIIFFSMILRDAIVIMGVTAAIVGVAVWLALKKVKEFNAIKEGVKLVKEGHLYHTIDITGNGEFGKLASDINTIADGLNKAVDNELKSERLKTELITNVSHDIRTPLTSIITYVDLLKNEKDEEKIKEYVEVLEQKSHRLKTLTDDLFEAAKASSGSISVNYETIDIVSLLTQGLGELDDKIKEQKLDFIINHPKDKVFIEADGTLLWRVIENLMTNIFKYALEGSRVYIDIEETEKEVSIIMKNISAYELNISADELMERFKRGDESRNSPGSGLGLSIAKSLVEIQKGSFDIEIDGDLFKSIIKFYKKA
ncbi:HAMP domain-containing sensor histidine kinase [Proteiniborus sp.]|uniref:sensor histidine kinase n=1 Tax=Proteiniborus sp. TaxID=2079015 RepID=UPI003324CE99